MKGSMRGESSLRVIRGGQQNGWTSTGKPDFFQLIACAQPVAAHERYASLPPATLSLRAIRAAPNTLHHSYRRAALSRRVSLKESNRVICCARRQRVLAAQATPLQQHRWTANGAKARMSFLLYAAALDGAIGLCATAEGRCATAVLVVLLTWAVLAGRVYVLAR